MYDSEFSEHCRYVLDFFLDNSYKFFNKNLKFKNFFFNELFQVNYASKFSIL
jgi:hypothetical protein